MTVEDYACFHCRLDTETFHVLLETDKLEV
jgi:hypothetical protein